MYIFNSKKMVVFFFVILIFLVWGTYDNVFQNLISTLLVCSIVTQIQVCMCVGVVKMYLKRASLSGMRTISNRVVRCSQARARVGLLLRVRCKFLPMQPPPEEPRPQLESLP